MLFYKLDCSVDLDLDSILICHIIFISSGQGRPHRRQEEEEKEEGILLHLHLQSVEAGSPRHWNLLKSHVNHELIREWHLRAYLCWGQPTCSLQQKEHHHISGDPDCRETVVAWWIGQARRQWGYQGCHQIHNLQVNLQVPIPLFYMPFSGQPHIPNNNIQIADELLMYLSLGLPSWYSEASSQHRRDLIVSTLRRKPPSLIGLKLLAPGPMSRILQTLSRWRDSGSKVSGLMIFTVRFLLLTWLVLGGVGLHPLAAAAKLLLVPWLVMLIRKIN